MNYHFDKPCRRTTQMKEFFDSLNIDENSDKKFYETNAYSYESFINGSKSLIDRVMGTKSIQSMFEHSFIDYGYMNSDHHLCTMRLENKIIQKQPKAAVIRKPSLCWKKATDVNLSAYREKANKACKEIFSRYLIDHDANKLINNTTDALRKAANLTIPKVKSKAINKHKIAGWNDVVGPILERINWLKSLTHQYPNEQLKLMLRREKAAYKRAVRQLQKLKQLDISNKVAEQTSKVYQFVNYKTPQMKSPSVINNVSKEKQKEMWYEFYLKTLGGNTVPLSVPIKSTICSQIPSNIISTQDLSRCINTNIPEILEKSYEDSYNYLYSPKSAHMNIAFGLNEWCKQVCANKGKQNYELLRTSITPIPKSGKEDYTQTKSWRPIACSTTVCYLFEKIMVERIKPYLKTHENQFAYKPKHGCIQPIAMLKEAGRKLTDFQACFLDATAAFDKISWNRLRDEFKKRQMPQHLQQIIYGQLRNTSFNVKWDNETTSNVFYATKGVKQGGCLSALIFASCYDELIKKCQTSQAGIFLHGCMISILVYADDILLLSHSPYGLKLLLDITKEFCRKYSDIELNSDKSMIIRMGTKVKNKEPVPIYNIPTHKSAKYLGIFLNEDSLEEARVVRSLYSRTNLLLKQNKNVNLCSKASKLLLVNAYGSVYALETFSKTTPKIGSHLWMSPKAF